MELRARYAAPKTLSRADIATPECLHRNWNNSRCHEVPVNVKPVLGIRYRFVGTTRIRIRWRG
jgi:hypothetical protein